MGVHDTKLKKSIVEGHTLSEITVHMDKIVNINFQCKARQTALHIAVMHNNVEVAALLLQRGADMMIVPLKKCYKRDYECTLLIAFTQAKLHEDMQLLLLRHISTVVANSTDRGRDKFDRVALETIARVAQYAMLYSSTRVFFAVQEIRTKMVVVNSREFNPLMFAISRIGVYEENVEKIVKIHQRVVEILDKDSTMLWQRYHHQNGTKKGTLLTYTGGTALGLLLFYIQEGRQKRCTEHEALLAVVERRKARMARLPSEWKMMGCPFGIHEKNLAMMRYLANEFAPCLFARMLPSMRIALGMGTHARLGNQHICCVRLLNCDIINMVFNELVRGITTAPHEYKYMLF